MVHIAENPTQATWPSRGSSPSQAHPPAAEKATQRMENTRIWKRLPFVSAKTTNRKTTLVNEQ